MNYLEVASRNANKPAPPHTTTSRPAPVQAPKPTPPPAQPEPEEEEYEQGEEAEVEEEVEEVDEEGVEIGGDEDVVPGGGLIRTVFDEENAANVIVSFLSPAGLSALGRTCKYFNRAVFTSPNFWSLLTGLPEPSSLTVRFFIDTSNAEEGQKENIQSIPLSQLKSEYQKNQLVKFWLRTVSSAYSAREAEKAKSQDPTEKRELKAVLKGGFSIASGQNEKPILRVNNLAHIPQWLNALISLIRGTEKSVTLSVDEGSVSLTRVGRGGHLVSVTVKAGKDKENAIYDFGSFSEQIREKAEVYFKIVGACRTKLKKPQQVNQPNAFPEIEKFINEVLGHDRLHTYLSSIEKLLKGGAIPHSTLPEYFKRKAEEKLLRTKQENSEAGSILTFLRKNLPQTFEETKKARDILDKKIKQQIENDFYERERSFQEQIRVRNELRKAEAEAAKAAKSGKGGKADKAPKDVSPQQQKTPYKLIKKTDDDGFESFVKVDESGNVLKEEKNDKNKKDKKDKAAKEAKKAAANKPKVDANSPTNNPFAAVENAADAGAEIKDKSKQQPQKQVETQKGKENQKTTNKPAETKKEAVEPVKKSEPKKTEEKTKVEKAKVEKSKSDDKPAKSEKKQQQETPKKKTDKKEEKSNKKEGQASKKGQGSSKKGKSEEDKPPKPANVVATQQLFNPAVAIAILVFAILALYTVFLS